MNSVGVAVTAVYLIWGCGDGDGDGDERDDCNSGDGGGDCDCDRAHVGLAICSNRRHSTARLVHIGRRAWVRAYLLCVCVCVL